MTVISPLTVITPKSGSPKIVSSHITLEFIVSLPCSLGFSRTQAVTLVVPSSWHLAQGQAQNVQFQLATPITIRQTRYLEDYGKDGTQVEGPRAQLNQEEFYPRWPDTARPERADPTRLKGGVRITTVKVG